MLGTGEVTTVLNRVSAGDRAAAARLLPLVYDELRALAGGYFRRERTDHTLQPTALVHEAFVRLVRPEGASISFTDRAHFLALAAKVMRQILVDHARARERDKRGGGWARVSLDAAEAPAAEDTLDILALDEALAALAEKYPRPSRVVELRFFGGLTIAEAAHVLDVGTTTVEDDWAFARGWLNRRLGGGDTAVGKKAP